MKVNKAICWEDRIIAAKIIPAPVYHTLRAVVACSDLEKPTIKQINAKRAWITRKHTVDQIGDRTAARHIKVLKEKGLVNESLKAINI